MKLIKRFFKVLLILFVLFIGLLVALPYFFKDNIIARVKTEMNNNLNAKADFGDLGLSFFRSFPNLSTSIKDITVDGVDEFEGLRLAEIDALRLSLNVMSVIKNDRPIEVKSVLVDGADIHLKVLDNGKANYDIVKTSEEEKNTDENTSDFEVALKKYAIQNSNIIYDDASSMSYAKIENLNHSGKGDFTSTVYDLVTQTQADALTVSNAGITYISAAKTDIDLTLNADMNSSKYTISDNDIRLNDMGLALKGWVTMLGDDIDMDLNFNTPDNDFKDLLSMIPGAYSDDFRGVKANGKMTLNGLVKGTYNDTNIPAVKLNIDVNDASFQYPDLPMGMSQINAKAKVDSPGGNFDKMVVDVSKLHFKLGENPFDAVFNLRTPMSDPQVKAKAVGKLGLTDLSKAFPMEGVKSLSGLIDADIDIDTRLSYIENQQYDQVNMKGDLSMINLNYEAEDMPPVIIKNAQMNFTPQRVNVPTFQALLGKSDVQAYGEIDNVLAYFSPTKTMKGAVTIRSNSLDLNEWMTETENAPTETIYEAPTTTESEVFDRFDFDIDADMKRIVYDEYELEDMVAVGNFTSEKINLTKFSTNLGKSDLHGTGTLDNVFDYVFNGETVRGNIDIQSNTFDLNPFMSSEETTEKNSSEPTTSEAPDRFDITFSADAKRVLYDIYTLENLKTKGNFKPEKLTLPSFSTNIGTSDIRGSGALNNVMNYVYKNEVITGNFDLNSRRLNIDELYGETAESTTEITDETAESSYPLPENMNIDLTANIDEVMYDKMSFKEMRGDMKLNNQSLNIEDFTANTLKGNLSLSGLYSTINPEKPVFDFKYKMNKIDFQETFNTFASVEVIAPIIEFVDGIFTTELSFKGALKPDMSIDYNSLSAEGLVHTLNAVVKNFEPLSKLSEKLAFKDISKLEITDTKNWFDIVDGQFILRPFGSEFKDVTIKGEGKHALTAESMQYQLNFTVPRAKLEGNAIGSAANTGINLLSEQASKMGVNIWQSENLNFDVAISGSHKKPKFDIKFVGAGGKTIKEEVTEQVKEVAEEKVESVKDKAEEIVDKKKEEATQVVEKEVDKAVGKVEKEVEKVVEKTTEEVKDKVGEAVGTVVDSLVKDKVNDKVEEVLGDKAKEELDKLKDKIKFPKFGKKDKDGGN